MSPLRIAPNNCLIDLVFMGILCDLNCLRILVPQLSTLTSKFAYRRGKNAVCQRPAERIPIRVKIDCQHRSPNFIYVHNLFVPSESPSNFTAALSRRAA